MAQVRTRLSGAVVCDDTPATPTETAVFAAHALYVVGDTTTIGLGGCPASRPRQGRAAIGQAAQAHPALCPPSVREVIGNSLRQRRDRRGSRYRKGGSPGSVARCADPQEGTMARLPEISPMKRPSRRVIRRACNPAPLTRRGDRTRIPLTAGRHAHPFRARPFREPAQPSQRLGLVVPRPHAPEAPVVGRGGAKDCRLQPSAACSSVPPSISEKRATAVWS